MRIIKTYKITELTIFAYNTGGAGTFLMEHMPKIPKGGWVYFVIYENYPWYFFVTKKGGVPQAIFEKYHCTFLVIIMLKFVSYIRYTVKKSMKQNK